jgi:hypothetical protein
VQKVGIFNGHLVFLRQFGIGILSPFGIFCGHLVFLSVLGTLYREKSGNPGTGGEQILLVLDVGWLREHAMTPSMFLKAALLLMAAAYSLQDQQ